MKVIISSRARGDLAFIARHGLRHFGKAASRDYLANLKSSIAILGANPGLAHVREELSRPVRIHPVGSHLIVHEIEDGKLRIVRVLHAKQNWQDHL
jgi:toxin ParE1/3/4